MHSFTRDYKKLYPSKSGNASAILEEMNQTQAALKKYLGEDFKSSTWRYP